jgi:hypothetical protein
VRAGRSKSGAISFADDRRLAFDIFDALPSHAVVLLIRDQLTRPLITALL